MDKNPKMCSWSSISWFLDLIQISYSLPKWRLFLCSSSGHIGPLNQVDSIWLAYLEHVIQSLWNACFFNIWSWMQARSSTQLHYPTKFIILKVIQNYILTLNFFEGQNHKQLKNTLIYKAKKFMFSNANQENFTFFQKILQEVKSRCPNYWWCWN